jgi:lactose/L-arabinose transport system permease protein
MVACVADWKGAFLMRSYETAGPSGAPPAAVHRWHLRRWRLGGPRRAPYAFIAPFFILYGIFWVYPVLYSFWLSFHRWTAQASIPVGWSNYTRLGQDQEVQTAFLNDIWYLVVNNIFQLTIALGLAVLLDAAFLRGRGALRAAYFMPNIVSGVVAAILFTIILGQGGVLNQILPSINWLASTTWAKPAVILTGGWRWIGYWVIILLAGLQQIPGELKETAAVEGASPRQVFWYVTLPLLRPILLFVLVVNSIGTLQIFEEPLLLFPGNPGGPDNAATTPVLEIYKAAFTDFDLGYAAAISWVLALLIMAIIVLQMVVLRRRGWSE